LLRKTNRSYPINIPGGSWACNDDSNGLNPMIGYPSPATGQYDIYIGLLRPGAESATLYVSELPPQW